MTDGVVESSRVAIQKGSKSFAAASRLFPADIRDDCWMLYSWCRHCDDEIDGQVLGHGPVGVEVALAQERLARLRASTVAALSGGAVADPAFRALQQVGRRHEIPLADALTLLDGFAMDVDGRRFETLEDTLDYAFHVAGVVGVMMARIMGVRTAEVLRRAQDLGLGFQLTNIARDVVEDARAGRVYLPGRWLDEAGVPRDAVADARHRPALAAATARLLAAAEPYYDSARWGLRSLGLRSAWAIATARGVYRQIGVEVARRGPAAWDERVSVSTGAKAALIAQASLVALRAGTLDRWRTAPARPPLWSFL
ncbi:phytoene/squalene synthase family protein [Zavarzinia sp. CC-PAN008]|uniref:phytoene/squalene synthase family protein n=1 Tax=Zavarzinia sp. CC-PAN008 TaxID=3243332 RepID=UPI003F74861D